MEPMMRLFPALALTALMAPADSARAGGTGPVAEIVTFRLQPGIEVEAFLDLAKATEPPVTRQPGFLRRSLSVDESGLWTDYVVWRDMASAHAAAKQVVADPAFAPFGAAIAPDGLTMRHAAVRWTMGD
jgi:quinol monooxygenase YgiN